MTHGYGAAMGFMYRNWQVMGESAGEVGRSAYAVDWLGMGRSARVDPKELEAGKKATVKQRVEKVCVASDRAVLFAKNTNGGFGCRFPVG